MCIAMNDNETTITSDAGMEYQFNYDYSIWSCDPKDPKFVGQEKLYELMGRPLLNSAFEGYNTCLFAYGQVLYMITYQTKYQLCQSSTNNVQTSTNILRYCIITGSYMYLTNIILQYSPLY